MSGSRDAESAERRGVGLGSVEGAQVEAVALEQADQLLRPAGAGQRDLERDDLALDELAERLLHRLHALLRPGLHDRVDLLDLALADQVPRRVVRKEDLER